jgi:DNA-binding PadR family transcriptional regulator
MSVQTARENAVLDTLARRTRTVRDITSALDGDGMALSSVGIRDLLAGLTRRGLVSQAGSVYQLTEAGRASVRRRKSGYAGARGPVGGSLAWPAASAGRAGRLPWTARQQAWR